MLLNPQLFLSNAIVIKIDFCEIKHLLLHSSVIFSHLILFLKLAYTEYFSFKLICPDIRLCQDYKFCPDLMKQVISSILSCLGTANRPKWKWDKKSGYLSIPFFFLTCWFLTCLCCTVGEFKITFLLHVRRTSVLRSDCHSSNMKNMTNEMKDKEPNTKQCIGYVNVQLHNKEKDSIVES